MELVCELRWDWRLRESAGRGSHDPRDRTEFQLASGIVWAGRVPTTRFTVLMSLVRPA